MEPSFNELAIATYVHYAANPRRIVGWLDRKGGADRAGFLVPSWRETLRISSGSQNAGRVLATTLLFQRAGVFGPATGKTAPATGVVDTIDQIKP